MAKPKRAPLASLRPRLGTLDTRTAQPAPKRADPELHSAAHQRWRAEVIRRSGGICQAPSCGRTGVRLFADHVVERQDGGAPLDPSNGQALCGSCHSAKTARARAARQGERHRPT